MWSPGPLNEGFALYVINSGLALGMIVILLAILNRFRTDAPTMIPRVVLRRKEATRAASLLVLGLFALLASHVVEMLGSLVSTPTAEAAHEVVETISLFFLFVSHLWFWRIVGVKPDPGTVLRIPEGAR